MHELLIAMGILLFLVVFSSTSFWWKHLTFLLPYLWILFSMILAILLFLILFGSRKTIPQRTKTKIMAGGMFLNVCSLAFIIIFSNIVELRPVVIMNLSLVVTFLTWITLKVALESVRRKYKNG